MDGHTDKPKAICPFNVSKVGTILNLKRLYIDQINYLSYPLLWDHIVTIFPLLNGVNPDRTGLTRAADLCLPLLQKCYRRLSVRNTVYVALLYRFKHDFFQRKLFFKFT